MVDNPYEPAPPSPFEAGPRLQLGRPDGYKLPPIGPGRHFDAAHHTRQEWTGRLIITLLLVVPAVYVLGLELGWW